MTVCSFSEPKSFIMVSYKDHSGLAGILVRYSLIT